MSLEIYRAKPVTVEAMRFTGANKEEVAHELAKVGLGQFFGTAKDGSLELRTMSGIQKAYPGDYLIKDSRGEFYPCPQTVFEAKYSRVLPDGAGEGDGNG